MIGEKVMPVASRLFQFRGLAMRLQNTQQVCFTTTTSHIYPIRACFFSTMATHNDTDDDRVVVSILGPPNAGKSTLFNRLMCKQANKTYKLSSEKQKRRKARSKGRLGTDRAGKARAKSAEEGAAVIGGAIVSSVPGTTRDRRECIGRIGGTLFSLVDTAGIDGERIAASLFGKQASLKKQMMAQTMEAAEQADLILLLLDAKVGVTYDLMETAKWLRKLKSKQRVVLLANKLEGDAWSYPNSPVMDHLAEASRVGFGEPIPISAQHGEGMADIALVIEEVAREKAEKRIAQGLLEDTAMKDAVDEKPLQLAILGRQNVGKSTLVNALLQEDRVLHGSQPGLTRDAIAVEWSWKGRPVKLVDTAGIRKVTQRDYTDPIEDLAVQDAMRALKVADVAVLVLDASARKLQRQELAIADAIVKEGRSLVIAANKMDLLVDHEYSSEAYANDVREHVEARLPMLRQTPVVAMSSLKGQRVDDLMPVVFDARDRWERVMPTGLLNRWLEEVLFSHAPPMQPNGRPTRIKYIMQTKARPPTFLLFCNVNTLPISYMRFLTRNFQDSFEMYGMEVRIAVKKSAKKNPFEERPGTKLPNKGGIGIGGKEARQKRLIKHLKATGEKFTKRRQRRRKTR